MLITKYYKNRNHKHFRHTIFRNVMNKKYKIMEERKTIYLCLAHMSEDGMEQKYVKEAFDTNWGT